MDDNIESLKRQLEIRRRNLHKLEERKALYGWDVPLKLLNEIEHEKKEIARLKEEIRIIIEVGLKTPDTPKKLILKEDSARVEVRGRRGCIAWWGSLRVELKVAYIGLIGAVIVAIIGLGQPVIAEFAKSLFAPTPTSVAVAPTPTPTPRATTTPTSTSTSTPMPTSTVTPTNTPTLTPTPTATPTNTPSPTPTLPCPPADAEGTVPPAVAISSITFIVNGVKQVVNDAHSLKASSDDLVQVREVTICVDPFEGDGGGVNVEFNPVEHGQEIVSEIRGTEAVGVTSGFTSIPGPDHTWTIGSKWQHFSVVSVHYPPGGTTSDCGKGTCERDDRMIVRFQ